MEIQLWHEFLNPYQMAVHELMDKFRFLIEEYHTKGIYCPIESVSGRVKTISSILEKLQKKNIPFEKMEEQIEDIAGVRLICQFVEDIEKVAAIIEGRGDMRVREKKDYINHMKDSGYRSYHLIVDYDVETLGGKKSVQAEIQIRTMAMDFWATIEHSLQYKYKSNIPAHIKQRLSNAADAVIRLDNEMATVRSEIMDAQISSQIEKRLVVDILNNIENIFRLSSEREVIKIQDEFYKVYEKGDLDELRRFHRELDTIAEGYRAQADTDGIGSSKESL